MSRIVIVYDSKSGNTEQLAKAVAEGAGVVKGTGVSLHKVGTRFPISLLDQADAIVLGSPSEYGNATSEMRALIESMVELKRTKKLALRNKIGGVFGSYGWDGGWATENLAERMKELGITLIPPVVAAVDRMNSIDLRIDADSLQKCRDLGNRIAEQLQAKKSI
jgi:flavorubredoxin